MKKIVTIILMMFFILSLIAETKEPIVEIQTSVGNITLKLFPDKAPKTVENFLSYVKKGYYENTVFHRVINNFMIQGGGFSVDRIQKKTDAPIKNEADNGLANKKGTIAMARTNLPHSATSQFFINTKDNSFLDFKSKDSRGYGYCVFGEVIDGYETVEKIEKTPTTTKQAKVTNGGEYPMRDWPVDDIVIKKIILK